MQRSGRDLMLSVTLSHGDSGVDRLEPIRSRRRIRTWPSCSSGLADGSARALLIPTAAAGDRTQSNSGHQRRDGAHPLRAGDGSSSSGRMSRAIWQRAEALLREATKRDPKFALAWARLGDTYWETLQETSETQMGVGGGRRHQHGSDAGSTAAGGLDRAGEDQRGHGTARSGAQRLEQSAELQPTSDEAHQLMGQILQAMGRRDEATRALPQGHCAAAGLLAPYSMLGAFYYSIGRYPRGDRRLYAGHPSSRRTTPGDFTTSGPSITALATPAMP